VLIGSVLCQGKNKRRSWIKKQPSLTLIPKP
jgi:hypothetical protein